MIQANNRQMGGDISGANFLDGRVTLLAGDCLEILAALPEGSVDSVVTDPPYELGFMGKKWDGTGIANRADLWALVMRVLRPGGHLVAFSGTRTYHRMACAIEDAGFEIRDQIGWAYGSGFPKSHDVSKGIDKRGGQNVSWFGPWLREQRKLSGVSQRALCETLGFHGAVNHGGAVANWELGYGLPTAEQFEKMAIHMGLPLEAYEKYREAEREVIGQQQQGKLAVAPGQGADRSQITLDITAPATAAAKHWQGWGTALKPAWEPICLARKPLIGTVAANVLEHGVGALNIDGCRVETNENLNGGSYSGERRDAREDSAWQSTDRSGGKGAGLRNGIGEFVQPPGRWPANLIHDGSEEVIGAFPMSGPPCGSAKKGDSQGWIAGSPAAQAGSNAAYVGDTGSAARFFYTAKADAEDRLGSKHPTVKPLDLMQWLVRLVTPKGGTVLDPFAGTGTTGEAAWREGCRAILIEREAEYQADIARQHQRTS
jgi:DNA modification methylase